MIDKPGSFWGYPSLPPAWALRALEKGIIDPARFEALVELTASESLSAARVARRGHPVCTCRRRQKRGCTSLMFR